MHRKNKILKIGIFGTIIRTSVLILIQIIIEAATDKSRAICIHNPQHIHLTIVIPNYQTNHPLKNSVTNGMYKIKKKYKFVTY